MTRRLPPLTPHQRDALVRLLRWHHRTGAPVPIAEIGSAGAFHRLADKHRVSITRRYGPQGGTHEYVEPIYPNIAPAFVMRAFGRQSDTDTEREDS